MESRFPLAVSAQPLPEFVRSLALDYGVSVIYDPTLIDRTVTLEAESISVSELMSVLAHQYQTEVTRIGQVWYLGTLDPTDVATFVSRFHLLEPESIREVVRPVLTGDGSLVVLDEGLLIIVDRVDVLRTVSDLIQSLPTDSPNWLVQVLLVNCTQSDRERLGLDVNPSFRLALAAASSNSPALAAAALASPDLSYDLDATLTTILQAQQESSNSLVLASPTFLLVEGRESVFRQGQRVPIPRRVVSDQGTVTTAGFDFAQVGTEIKVKPRSVSPEKVRLSIDINLDSIDRFIQEAPVTSGSSYTTVCDVPSGGVYLIGTLRTENNKTTRYNWFRTGDESDNTQAQITIWVRVYQPSL